MYQETEQRRSMPGTQNVTDAVNSDKQIRQTPSPINRGNQKESISSIKDEAIDVLNFVGFKL